MYIFLHVSAQEHVSLSYFKSCFNGNPHEYSIGIWSDRDKLKKWEKETSKMKVLPD